MKNFKNLLIAFVVAFSTTISFAENAEIEKGEAISLEIEKMLRNSDLIIEEDFTVKVIFTVTSDKRISIEEISSPNEEVNEFLRKRLDQQKLHGASWYSNKIYELPVKVQARN
ncbi:hypothetical protein [Salinimicrobium oceani]|uniref:TonB protein C-terminal n=1 Tax=Salinimicrobium oceani TaxID=2722702 RepID=A0ABX1CTQ2_9FLAO|nr:hypothetical protein [Salinimicrobium oceani]NJW51664.1 hypothetical protein [Salinimicrobium oceani]